MRHTLRRILWIVPTLGVISIVAFFLLTLGQGATLLVRGIDRSVARERLSTLPRFFNPAPRNVRDLSLQAARTLAEGGPGANLARAELIRLGGAALPHVLPGLDALGPEGRARVAVELAPVARRMGIAAGADLDSPASAVVFWTRYWQERAIDFRPAVVRRLVRRVADRPSLSGDDVLQLDTYALAEIVDAFGTVSGPDDVARARRLGELASHATGLNWNVVAGASIEEARAVVTRWHSWWALYRSDYMTFDGPSRALAMLTETQYGKWAAEAARNRLGIGADGKPVFDTLKERAKVTFWLVGSALCGGYVLGVLIGLFAAGRARNPWRPHAARLRALPLDWLLSIAALLAAGVPVIALATALAPSVAGRRSGLGAALCVAVAAALVSRHQRAASSTVLDQEYARTETAFGASPFRTARRGFRAASTAAISLFGVDLPALITTAFVVERVLGLPGLGPRTFEAVSARDLSWLMAVAVLSALVVALAQIASDAVLTAVDPRVRLALERKRGAPE